MNPILVYIAMIWSVLSLLSFGVTFYGYTQIARVNAYMAAMENESPPNDGTVYRAWLRARIEQRVLFAAHRRQLVRLVMRASMLAWMCLVGAGVLALVVGLNLMADR